MNKTQHVTQLADRPHGAMHTADHTVCAALVRPTAEQHDLYRSLIDAMAEGVVFQTEDGVVRACNAAAERILGLSSDQLTGRSSLDPRWRAIHEDGTPWPGETHRPLLTLRTGEPLSNRVMGIH